MNACEFDRLLLKNLPHIHGDIFFSLDYASFKNCLEVSKSWNDLLTSEYFLKRGRNVFCEDIQKEIFEAAAMGNVDIIRRVLSSFMVDINFRRESGSPLTQAAMEGHTDVVYLLLDKGAEPNMATPNGSTPLHYGASEGHQGVVQGLLKRGAEPNMADQHGRTPLHHAAGKGHKDVVQLLLEKGAAPNMADHFGWTPISIAQNGHTDIANMLTEAGGIA